MLILGAGRSGTSTVTRALQALGVYLGRSFRRPVRKNPHGNYEERHLLQLSKAVRRALGLRAESVRLLEEEDWQTPELRRLQLRAASVIDREFSGHDLWAFKYGSTGRILPFWLDLLPRLGIEPAFVLAYRNPLSVANSRSRLNRFRGRQEQNNLEWLVNVVPYFERVKDFRAQVVDYDRLLSDPDGQLLRLARGLDLPISAEVRAGIELFSREFIRPDWRHTHYTDEDLASDGRIHHLVRRAAALLSALSRDELTMDDPALWREWHDIERELNQMAPILRVIDSLQTDVRRARWWDVATPLRIGWQKLPLFRTR